MDAKEKETKKLLNVWKKVKKKCLIFFNMKKRRSSQRFLQKHVYFDWSMSIFDKNAIFLKKIVDAKEAGTRPWGINCKLDINPESRMGSEIY